ncbi:MAG: aminoglycoside phosphotransferase family protein [Actinomycetota bacterium]|nr:aminoglycoside phosphotransferase family protein [Actinomycetota bacterium]
MTGSAGAVERLAQVLGHDPGPHTITPLLHNAGNAVTAGICRYAGAGWSLILKRVTPHGSGGDHWATSDQPEHWNYWQREPLAYRSGLAAGAFDGSGIGAPRLLQADDRPDGEVWLWLEDVAGIPGERWQPGMVADFARRLGIGQGSYLTGRPLPTDRWLSRRWLRQYVESKPVDGSLLRKPDAWSGPDVPAAFAGLRLGLLQLWDERDRLLAAVEAIPQTLSHLDVWPKNLLATPAGPVLLDWAFVGIGGLGEDPGNLVPDCVWDGFLPAAQIRDLADAVWKGYLGGLRDAGWAGDDRLARLGFTAGGAAKYAWLAEWALRRLRCGELSSYGGYSTVPVEQLLETYATVLRLLLEWAREALALQGSLGLA